MQQAQKIQMQQDAEAKTAAMRRSDRETSDAGGVERVGRFQSRDGPGREWPDLQGRRKNGGANGACVLVFGRGTWYPSHCVASAGGAP